MKDKTFILVAGCLLVALLAMYLSLERPVSKRSTHSELDQAATSIHRSDCQSPSPKPTSPEKQDGIPQIHSLLDSLRSQLGMDCDPDRLAPILAKIEDVVLGSPDRHAEIVRIVGQSIKRTSEIRFHAIAYVLLARVLREAGEQLLLAGVEEGHSFEARRAASIGLAVKGRGPDENATLYWQSFCLSPQFRDMFPGYWERKNPSWGSFVSHVATKTADEEVFGLFESKLAVITDRHEIRQVLSMLRANRHRQEAAQLLDLLDTSDPQTIEFVDECISGDTHPNLRWIAYEILSRWQPDQAKWLAQKALSYEFARTDDFSARATDALVRVLRTHLAQGELTATLERAYEGSADSRRRAFLLRKLFGQGTAEARGFVSTALVQSNAGEVLQEIFSSGGSLHEEERAFFIEHGLMNPNSTIRMQVLEQVEMLPPYRSIQLLAPVAANDPDRDVRHRAKLKLDSLE